MDHKTISQANFPSKFQLGKICFSNDQKVEVQKMLTKFAENFAKHRYNTELKIKLTPEHNSPVYVQIPFTPIHLRNELTVELADYHT